MMKWYENHRHNWSYCHDLRFWISFYFLCGWEAVEYGDIPPSCVYAICLIASKPLTQKWIEFVLLQKNFFCPESELYLHFLHSQKSKKEIFSLFQAKNENF